MGEAALNGIPSQALCYSWYHYGLINPNNYSGGFTEVCGQFFRF